MTLHRCATLVSVIALKQGKASTVLVYVTIKERWTEGAYQRPYDDAVSGRSCKQANVHFASEPFQPFIDFQLQGKKKRFNVCCSH